MTGQMIIKNYENLLSQGDEAARRVLLKTAEGALGSLNSYAVLKKSFKITGSHLCFGENQWDLSGKRNIYVVGGGKAANAMARAVEEILGDRITSGIVAVKHLEPDDRLKKIELISAGHPLPDADSLRASQNMLQLVEQAAPDDLFIGLISGGSSALLSLPVAGISLEDEIACTRELLASGARILEINAVRRHISAINGGRLAQAVEQRGAEMINFIISDGVGNAPLTDPLRPARFCGTPVAPDASTFADAAEVLNKYDLRGKVPRTVVEYIDKAAAYQETPKSFGDRVCHFVVQRVADGPVAALEAAKSQGLPAFILTTVLQGESREAGTFLACVAKEVANNRRPFAPPLPAYRRRRDHHGN